MALATPLDAALRPPALKSAYKSARTATPTTPTTPSTTAATDPVTPEATAAAAAAATQDNLKENDADKVSYLSFALSSIRQPGVRCPARLCKPFSGDDIDNALCSVYRCLMFSDLSRSPSRFFVLFLMSRYRFLFFYVKFFSAEFLYHLPIYFL